jgi:nucleoside-diphosphate-sugar epimerase
MSKILFIGGNGNISWYCVNEAQAAGHEVWLMHRGETVATRRAIQEGVRVIRCDARDRARAESALQGMHFDVVCDFICYNESHAALDVELFHGRTLQFIFISSVVVYRRATQYLPFTEETPMWDASDYNYANDKIMAERVFMRAHQESGFPITIIRPAHTYDTIVPVPLGHNCFTAPQRYLDGKPMLIAGDGTNLWSLCHSSDFARALVGVFNQQATIGEDYHIAGEEWLTWLDIADILLETLGVEKTEYVHVPAKDILELEVPPSKNMAISYLGKAFRGQRMWCDIYDNAKIKSVVSGWRCEMSFRSGIAQTFAWLFENEARRRFNSDLDVLLENLTNKYRSQ